MYYLHGQLDWSNCFPHIAVHFFCLNTNYALGSKFKGYLITPEREAIRMCRTAERGLTTYSITNSTYEMWTQKSLGLNENNTDPHPFPQHPWRKKYYDLEV